jgi:hypothetical protein
MLFNEFVGETLDTPAGTFVVSAATPRKGHPQVYGFVPAE